MNIPQLFTTYSPILLPVIAIWSLYWKGRALWISARASQTKWFIALLIINTFGILEIFYIYVINKKKENN